MIKLLTISEKSLFIYETQLRSSLFYFFKLGGSDFEDYDANEILNGKLTWADLHVKLSSTNVQE
jgi:hypothetical protein